MGIALLRRGVSAESGVSRNVGSRVGVELSESFLV